jgi:parallel beta-helix repeat protein
MNNRDGIALGQYSNYNTISQNNVSMNDCGLYVEYSTKNLIYSNNVVDNILQVNVTSPSTNTWDNGYPSGGNYWSDYGGADAYKGSYQNETGSDGIGDTPLVFDGNNTDRYPLMTPWTESSGPVGDVNGDGKVDMKDVGYVARRFMCVPGDLLWDAIADFNSDERINMVDIGTVARHFGESRP